MQTEMLTGGIVLGDFTFYSDFDSANMGRIERITSSEAVGVSANQSTKNITSDVPDAEFNIWTRPDCAGTKYENGNRTWFYFALKAKFPNQFIRLNMIDLNRQGKMYSQGMAPVYRIVPGKPFWDRIRDRPSHYVANSTFVLSFKYRTPENINAISYFAFTYPFSYTDLQRMLVNIDTKYLSKVPTSLDDIYYVRECLCYSLEGRRVELITISSYHGMTTEKEARLKYLFPDNSVERPYKLTGKKVIFLSARVHPGETPSSFVLNGFLQSLLIRDDPVAQALRRMYVFKIIPFLNPDGVAKGHYRTDTRGVNLNRMYLCPSSNLHPSIFAARALIRYYHYGFEKEDDVPNHQSQMFTINDQTDGSVSGDDDDSNLLNENISKQVSYMSLNDGLKNNQWCVKCRQVLSSNSQMPTLPDFVPSVGDNINKPVCKHCGTDLGSEQIYLDVISVNRDDDEINSNESGIFLYMDMHGHASKKGIFIYGNHFDDIERNVECMMLPKLMSINNHNFHFTACNFTERNMYLKDKRDGMSREGSGRVAILKLTGLIRSYTLECNYNTGRFVNVIPPTIKESHNSKMHTLSMPPKYTPQVFEEVGRALGPSILDLTGHNPCTRLPNSEFHSLSGLRDWLRLNCLELTSSNLKSLEKLHSNSVHSQGKSTKGLPMKSRPSTSKGPKVTKPRPATVSVTVERKENLGYSQPSCSNAVSRTRSSSRLKAKVTKCKKETLGKIKSLSVEKSRSKAKLKPSQNPLQKFKSDSARYSNERSKEESSRIQLREICFMKSNIGKAIIAKYNREENKEDNLVVSWEGTSSAPQVFTHKVVSSMGFMPNKISSEPGTSKQGAFRVHNFSKASSVPKSKNKKLALRRLASSTDQPLKVVDRKKKKRLKSK